MPLIPFSGKLETKEETKKGKAITSKPCAQQIYRSEQLPSDVDAPKVTVKLKDGALNIELPKAPHAKSMRIEAKAAS